MTNGDLITLGCLYTSNLSSNGVKLFPKKPWRKDTTVPGQTGIGDIPDYKAGDNIKIIDTNTYSDENYKIQWREVTLNGKKLLICDRNLLTNISWDDLNAQGLIYGKTVTIDGQDYKLRVLTGGSNYRSGTNSYSGGSPSANEWDQIITNEANIPGLPVPSANELDTNKDATDMNSTHNQFWNWFYMYSWAQESNTFNGNYRTIRGYYSARNFTGDGSTARTAINGWRPVLEPLNTTPTVTLNTTNNRTLYENEHITIPRNTNFTIKIIGNDSDVNDTIKYSIKVSGVTKVALTDMTKLQEYTYTINSTDLIYGQNSIDVIIQDNNGGSTTFNFKLNVNENLPIDSSCLANMKFNKYSKSTISFAELINHLT